MPQSTETNTSISPNNQLLNYTHQIKVVTPSEKYKYFHTIFGQLFQQQKISAACFETIVQILSENICTFLRGHNSI